jgi:DNA polymerase-3 subunit beta
MKILAKRDELLEPLLHVGGVVERRQTLPILANILVNARQGFLTFTATDLEVELRTEAVAEVDGELDFTLPARKLIDICKALPEGIDIELLIQGDKAKMRAGRGRYTLGMLPAQEYPSIEPATVNSVFSLPERRLKQLIDGTQFAMAQQDVRYYLNGMLLEVRPRRIRTVATDGHRLALCDDIYDGEGELDLQVIVPRKAVGELRRLLSSSEEQTAKLEVSSGHLRVHLKGTTFTTKLIDGRFPDYERVMPRGEPSFVHSDRRLLQQALARAAILSNEKYRGIRFSLSAGLLQLQAHNPEQDEAEEEVEVDYPGEELTIGFNVGYLLDVLNVIDEDTVKIAVTDANSSALITPAQSEKCQYVVMPMRL